VSNILIAIPVYNAREEIDLTLESCLSQNQVARILVSDNSSTDGTFEYLLSRYGKNPIIRIIQTPSNLGRTGNWNFLLDQFTDYEESYIKFLFSGEELLANCIESCEEVIAQNADVAAIAFEYFLNTGDSERINSENLKGRIPAEEVDRLNLVFGGFLGSIVSNVYSKEAIGTKRFNDNFVGKTDFDFSILMGRPAFYINKPLARSNIEHRRTFNLAWDYWAESEGAFNRSYWIEKERERLSAQEYKLARFNVFADFVSRNGSHYSFMEVLEIFNIVLKILRTKIIEKLRSKY
jgi:glycosyltransferase involved in cell wall biosynthesis